MTTEQLWRSFCLWLYRNLIIEMGGAKMKELADRYNTCLSYVTVADEELVNVARSSRWTFVVSIVPTYLPTYVWLDDFQRWWWLVGGGSWDVPCSAYGLC